MKKAKDRLALALIVLSAGACATTGATFHSGVGDAFLEHPPYYAGAARESSGSSRVGHLPIQFQRGASQPSIFDPRDGAATPTDRLLSDMNAFLDSITAVRGLSVRLAEGVRVSAAARSDTRRPPDVQFGCITEGNLPGGDCVARGDSALGRGDHRMRLAVGRPAPEWTAWMRDVARDNTADRVLVLTLEAGQYLPRQVGLLGKKEVELGTGYTAKLPWLTSLETPVMVLQLTGALVDTSGQVRRIGAEGIYPLRTRLLVSAVGGQEVLRDADVEAARTHVRDDLPGAPLAWKVALITMLRELTGAPR